MDRHVIVFEHDNQLREAIDLHFGLVGWSCEGFPDAVSVMRRLSERHVDLVVMELAIGAGSGPQFCERVRALVPARTPILLLANRWDDAQAVTALERCVDDFMSKPINVRELVARGRALIRRSHLPAGNRPNQRPIVRGDLVVDPARRRVDIKDVEVKMTNQEFRFLYTLAARAGVVFTRNDLLRIIWGADTLVTMRSVDALAKRVRRRIDAAAPAAALLETVRGVGYRFHEGM